MMLSTTSMMLSSSRQSVMKVLHYNHQFTTTATASIRTVTNTMVRAALLPRSTMMMALVGRNSGCVYMSTITSSDGKPILSSNHKHFPLPNAKGSVIYTETDEAPALATYSLYPVVSKVRNNVTICIICLMWYKLSNL